MTTPELSQRDELPPSPALRLQSLDVLRGLAVLAGLFVSVWLLGGLTRNVQNGLLISSKGFDYRLFGTVDILLNGKMRALICIVFGAGMLLFLAKKPAPDGPSVPDLFIRRQFWLIVLGVVNGLLFLWTHDLLFHLGIMGILLYPFVRLPAKGLLLAALLATLAYSGKLFWRYADDREVYDKYTAVLATEKKMEKDSVAKAKAMLAKGGKSAAVKKDTLTKKQAEEKGAWEGLVAGKKHDPKKDDGEKKKMRSASYAKLYDHLMPRLQMQEAQWTYQFGVWDLAGMIFLGMALFKLSFYDEHFAKQRYLLVAFVGVAAGVLLGWYRLHHQQLSLQDYGKYIGAHALPFDFFFPFERAFAALGYAGTVLFLLRSGVLNIIWRGVANAGQLALTNYLAQSIICTLFFTGLGGGYFGRMTQGQLYLFVVEVIALQIVFSTIWLRLYRIGPAEWLWRSLIRGKRLPLEKQRKKQPAAFPSTSSTTTIG